MQHKEETMKSAQKQQRSGWRGDWQSLTVNIDECCIQRNYSILREIRRDMESGSGRERGGDCAVKSSQLFGFPTSHIYC